MVQLQPATLHAQLDKSVSLLHFAGTSAVDFRSVRQAERGNLLLLCPV